MKKRFIVLLLVSALALSALVGCSSQSLSTSTTAADSSGSGAAEAESSGEWVPDRTITLICPWSAGGGSDLDIRTLVPYLEDDLGVTITVVNSTGANGWIAWNDLLQSDPDGYTIAQMSIPTVFSGYMDPQQNRDENLDSFALVANEVSDSDCMVVRAGDERFPDAESFIQYATENEVLAGDNGVGTNKQLLAENIKLNFPDIQITEVHQGGWSETYAAILGGHIDVGWGSIGDVYQAYQDGEVDLLCVFSDERSILLPDIPTFNELMSGYDITSPADRGFALPAGVDQAVYDRWVQAMDNCINNKEFIAQMTELAQPVRYIGGEEYTAYAKEQEAKMEKFADILGWN